MASKKKLKKRIKAALQGVKALSIELDEAKQTLDEVIHASELKDHSIKVFQEEIKGTKERHDREDAELIAAGFVRVTWLRENTAMDLFKDVETNGVSARLHVVPLRSSTQAFSALIKALRP